MPSRSRAQQRLMHMVENNPEMAKTTGVPLSVAKDFNRADHQRKLAQHLRGKR